MLEQYFNELNQQHFSGELPAPRLLWNGRLSSSAGRFRPGSRNPIRPRAPEIEIATYLKAIEDGPLHIRDTMLHEMVHYFLWHHKKPYGHTKEFNKILKRVGARRYNTVPKQRAVKHWYRCDSCLKYIPAQRKIKPSACAACCQKFNGGAFDKRFMLRLSDAPAKEEITVKIVTAVESPPPPPPLLEPVLPASEIVRRLEDLKNLIQRARETVRR